MCLGLKGELGWAVEWSVREMRKKDLTVLNKNSQSVPFEDNPVKFVLNCNVLFPDGGCVVCLLMWVGWGIVGGDVGSE